MTRAPRNHGFTLAELLVGLAVTSVILVAVTAAVIGVQSSYQRESEVKVLTENGRAAIQYMQRKVELAGYGIDPRMAFDVGALPSGGLARDNLNVMTATFNPAQAPLDGGVVVTDDLAFRYRDPSWLRGGTFSTGSITLQSATDIPLSTGQVMMVVCRGANRMVALSVASNVAAGQSSVPVTVLGAPWGGAVADSCFTGTGANMPWVFLVREQRLRIVNLNGRPWLVAFNSLSANPFDLSLNNFDPIAPDVENFQVAFGVNRAPMGLGCCQTAPDTGGDWIYGNSRSGSTPEAVFAQPVSPLATTPDYSTGYNEPARFTGAVANIRTVQLSLTMRTSRRDATGRKLSKPLNSFNWEAPTMTEDGFNRAVFHTVVQVPNMLSRSFFVPSLRAASDTRDLNSWGG
ncbi:MAG: PilW family protein [Archangium sp.]